MENYFQSGICVAFISDNSFSAIHIRVSVRKTCFHFFKKLYIRPGQGNTFHRPTMLEVVIRCAELTQGGTTDRGFVQDSACWLCLASSFCCYGIKATERMGTS